MSTRVTGYSDNSVTFYSNELPANTLLYHSSYVSLYWIQTICNELPLTVCKAIWQPKFPCYLFEKINFKASVYAVTPVTQKGTRIPEYSATPKLMSNLNV